LPAVDVAEFPSLPDALPFPLPVTEFDAELTVFVMLFPKPAIESPRPPQAAEVRRWLSDRGGNNGRNQKEADEELELHVEDTGGIVRD